MMKPCGWTQRWRVCARWATVIGMVLVGSFDVARAAEAPLELVWRIGDVDHSHHDLGNGANPVRGYGARYAKGIDFVVGIDEPREAFSAIHPGPVDTWAGGREHVFRVHFDRPSPRADCYELCIHVVDTHNGLPANLQVRLNGQTAVVQLKRGVGDLAIMQPDKGSPQRMCFTVGDVSLKDRDNTLALTVTKGCWLLYDAVTFKRCGDVASTPLVVEPRPSLFFVERDGKPYQEFGLAVQRVVGREPIEVVASFLTAEGRRQTFRQKLPPAQLGRWEGGVPIPPADAERDLTVTVTVGSQRKEVTLKQTPQKRWHIYCAPSTHTDIGYTAHQDEVIALHNRNTDLALALGEEFPRYHWNLESSWAAQVWLKNRPAHEHEKLFQAARDGRVGIEAGYLNMLTGLCSGEELVRTLYYSARLHREHGVPFASYTLTDAPSHVGSLPSILAGAGIRYISMGSNQTRAPILKHNIHHKCPFWWQGPDGARVLTWVTAGYSQAALIGLRDGVEAMRDAIQRQLLWWDERADYPYDAILLHGAYSDNVSIGRDIAEAITAYTDRYAYPKVILCSNDTFFRHIEANFAEHIPVIHGGGGSWWEDGAASTAVRTAQNRRTHQTVVAAEAVWALLAGSDKGTDVPEDTFNRVWDNILLYDEHTWGAHNSVDNPQSDFVNRQWATKASYGSQAADEADRLLEHGLLELARRVDAPDDAILVFNPSGHPRSGAVRVDLRRDEVLLDEKGRPLPGQVVDEDVLDTVTKLVRVEAVPALGYRTYRIARRDVGPAVLPNKPAVMENGAYRVELDPATGAVRSLVDKATGVEHVDGESPYQMGQFIYAAGGDCATDYRWTCPNPEAVAYRVPASAQLKPGVNGPVFCSLRSVASMPTLPKIEMEVRLFEHEPRVDFVYHLDKKMVYEKEAVYIAFPLAGANPRFAYEIGAGAVRPNEDHWPGACRDWFAVQRWVTMDSDRGAVAWSAVDTPLITLCDMNPGRWLDDLRITNGTIFAYAMNNYWFTNYKAGQDHAFTFRYSLTTRAEGGAAWATRFGESVQSPLRSVRLFAGRTERDLPARRGLCDISPDHVEVMAFKVADDGNGLILRLREVSGRAARVRVQLGRSVFDRVQQCDLVERCQRELPIHDRTLTLPLKPWGMTTLRLTAAGQPIAAR